MLDFSKLFAQIKEVGSENIAEGIATEEIVLRALDAYDRASVNWQEFAVKLQENLAHVFWPIAQPLEPFGTNFEVSGDKLDHTVVASDGSQIMPSHHEIHNCYLLNVGLVIVSYGIKNKVVLDSIPTLYHKPTDLYPLVDRRRVHIDELYISLERYLLELETIAASAKECLKRALPAVALVDGSLIPWSVEKMPDSYQASFGKRLSAVLTELRSAGIPLVGYVSSGRSADVINALRIFECPYEKSLCSELCGHLNEEDFPCSMIWPLGDRQLFARRLPLQSRSNAFLSGSSFVRKLEKSDKTCFAYLNVGSEIARLEFPHWVFADKELLDLAFQVVFQQSLKGRGYPISLAEAHYLAVIRASDRKRFFDLLGDHLVALGMTKVSVSPKELRKRQGIV